MVQLTHSAHNLLENLDGFRTRAQQRGQFLQPFLRHEHGVHGKAARQQAAHNFFTFGHEDAFLALLHLAAHRAIRLELRSVQRGYSLHLEHGEGAASANFGGA